MKIYFEDGKLQDVALIKFETGCDFDFTVDAANGYSFCEDRFEITKRFHPECSIYTNSLMALDNRYVWNDQLGVPELYLRHKDTCVFTRIDKLTTRELRQGHNLMKMYMAGEFDSLKLHPRLEEMENETLG